MSTSFIARRRSIHLRALACQVLAVLIFLILSIQSHAAQVTFEMQGTIVEVPPELAGSFSVSQPYSGSFTFESGTPNQSGSTDFGSYEALVGGSVTIGAFTFTLAIPGVVNSIIVGDNFPSEDWQSYRVEGEFTGPSIGAFAPSNAVLLNLRDTTGTAFDSIDLPITPPNLGDFDPLPFNFALGFADGLGNFPSVLGQVTSVSLKTNITTIEYTGVVEFTSNLPSGLAVNFGDIYTSTVVFDTDAGFVVDVGTQIYHRYHLEVENRYTFSAQINGFSWTLDNSNPGVVQAEISVRNEVGGIPLQQLETRIADEDGLVEPGFAFTLGREDMYVNLRDSTEPLELLPGVLAIPQDTDDVNLSAVDFPSGLQFEINSGSFFDSPDTWRIGGRITDITISSSDSGGNAAPTADAGADQAVRIGDTVCLDGDASFDDNTPTESLQYIWSFTLLATGSSAVLLGADMSTPCFFVDVGGTYLVQLVVTDEAGLESLPDEVMISSDNLAPTADAGLDQLVIVGSTVFLDGLGSTDPEVDPLNYSWVISVAPVGSIAPLVDADTAFPSFIPDIEGTYELMLVVSDFIGPSIPDSVDVMAVSPDQFAVIAIVSAAESIVALGSEQVTTQGNQNALTNFLMQAAIAIQAGDLTEAISKLQKALLRTDGCVLRGTPDGDGPGRDWITDCAEQAAVYASLTSALEALSP